jgi:hypothetical protein
MHNRAVRWVGWVFSWLVPANEREALLGDLAEEYALRAQGASCAAAFRWYLRQVCVSAPPLLWVRVARAAWPGTVGVALLAYVAVAVVEITVNWAIAHLSAVGAAAYNPLGMALTFPMVVLIGYFAAGYRRSAAIVLAVMMLLAVSVMTLTTTEHVPFWYRVAYFLVGPAAAFIGSGLSRGRSGR